MKTRLSLNSIKENYTTFQSILAISLFALIILTPFIGLFIADENRQNWLAFQIGLNATFTALLFRLFIQALSKSESSKDSDSLIREPKPLLFQNYIQAQTKIKECVRELLKNNENVHIQIMGVAMQFSWKILIEDELPELLKLGNEKQKITIDLYVVQPEHLLKWGQKDLIKYSQMCVDCTPELIEQISNNINGDRVSINIYQYDNIPHRHGILINNTILFRSKCSFRDNGKLLVGQNAYKMFKTGEHIEAIDSIELFNNWANAYRKRDEHIVPKLEKSD